MPTIRDAANAAGVSTATVSRVINQTGPVSPAVRERVERAIAALSYRPNALARSLRTESTGTIGLIVSNILNPFFTELARAAEDVAIADGYTLVLGNSDELPAKEERYINQFLEKRVDGLILNPATANAPYIAALAGQGVPIVLIDRDVVGVNAPLVRADGRGAIFDLVEHLKVLGHRNLGIISGPLDLRNGFDRYHAFMDAAAESGISVAPAHVAYGDFERSSGFAAMIALLDSRHVPDVVFVSNGRMTLGALEAVRDRGLRVGEDIGIASFDDDPFFRLLDPALTAIEQPTSELGRVAMAALIAGIKEESMQLIEPLKARLIIRRSCGESHHDGTESNITARSQE